MPGTLKVGGNIIASHTGVEGAGTVTLQNIFASTSDVQGNHKEGTITTGTNILTVNNSTDILNGDYVVGEGIAPGTTVSSGEGTTTLTLSANVNASLSAAPVSFYHNNKALSAGTVAGQLCRAWVNFSAAASPSIRSSYNVTSVTQDGGTGKYLINLLSALPDSPNATVLVCNGDLTKHINRNFVSSGAQTSTTQIYVSFFDTAARDPDICSVAVFR